MKSKNLTMKDIAQRAGVSITTVSHVINKTRHVNRETKESVLKAIEELNYRGLKSGKTNKIKYIGVIVADIREDYYISIIKAIETVATDFEISIIFCDSEDDPEKEEKNISMLLARRISGLIIAPIESDHIPKSLQETSVPVVLIDRQYESHRFLFVGINNFNSSYLGTLHLFNKGSRRIGFIGYSESVYTIKQRIMGYQACLMEHEDSSPSRILSLSYHKEDSYPLIKKFIEEENLDGIICATSTVCYEVIDVLDSLDSKTQKNLRIISYDDNRWLDYLKFPVSVISQPTAEIGSAALENLIQLIEQSNLRYDVKRELFFDVSIIDRLK
ncbi:LacI family DNA-binding transcriptional regulator [Marispirochaeta sp.]|jgi:LacI family transcriptional regulator|uniref:LacI family DNA-binding transcriptional regulator n=1 Tax=Marispirochaeta sp. TaxID=2038653 RepID=UPI0029C71AF7|nr:LacI family DNA-binding transcriptional regulator [Marispirochaeta sp.]